LCDEGKKPSIRDNPEIRRTGESGIGMTRYVHGYSKREMRRLREQSAILSDLLHDGTRYEPGRRVLEAGCGVGAQSVILAARSPEARFTAVDLSAESIARAKAAVRSSGHAAGTFLRADIHALPFEDGAFDSVFVCFVLEHLDDPGAALRELKRVLRSGGDITVIEGDHGSCFWHPETAASRRVWECMIRAQALHGHDSRIGRRLTPLLRGAGFSVRRCGPRWVYGDALRPGLLDGMVNQIIVPMVQTAKERALAAGWADEAVWRRGIRDLERSGVPPEGTFFYTWFKAEAVKE